MTEVFLGFAMSVAIALTGRRGLDDDSSPHPAAGAASGGVRRYFADLRRGGEADDGPPYWFRIGSEAR